MPPFISRNSGILPFFKKQKISGWFMESFFTEGNGLWNILVTLSLYGYITFCMICLNVGIFIPDFCILKLFAILAQFHISNRGINLSYKYLAACIHRQECRSNVADTQHSTMTVEMFNVLLVMFRKVGRPCGPVVYIGQHVGTVCAVQPTSQKNKFEQLRKVTFLKTCPTNKDSLHKDG